MKERNCMISRLDHNCLDKCLDETRRDTRPRHYIRNQDQDSNPKDLDQDSEHTGSRLSRDEMKQCLENPHHWRYVT